MMILVMIGKTLKGICVTVPVGSGMDQEQIPVGSGMDQ